MKLPLSCSGFSLPPPRPWRDERLFPALRALLPCVSSARSSLIGRGEDYTQQKSPETSIYQAQSAPIYVTPQSGVTRENVTPQRCDEKKKERGDKSGKGITSLQQKTTDWLLLYLILNSCRCIAPERAMVSPGPANSVGLVEPRETGHCD